MRVGVVNFPGTLDNRDVIRALNIAELTPVEIWHQERNLEKIDALILPGGKSYGDYLRPGALAKTAPIMAAVIEKAKSGLPILGIGNGFQILLEAGLLAGGLAINHNQQFIRRDAEVIVANNNTAWTSRFDRDESIVLPTRNTHGAFTAEAKTLERIEAEGLVALRYENPIGKQSDIAGVSNAKGNVVGLMPHPEFAVEPGFGPDTKDRMRSGVDGLRFFTSLLLNN
ncbi:MAG TPA: phosphoribosylformylglycinamidine synthase subunit PurQ [Microbacteriaceae bacterium]|nr:phosphoribosylformylglycinamidine synthase subunit PurQ [Microbacteriaceae bacterium]